MSGPSSKYALKSEILYRPDSIFGQSNEGKLGYERNEETCVFSCTSPALRCGDDGPVVEDELRPRGDPRLVLQQTAGAEEHHQEAEDARRLLTVGRRPLAAAGGTGRPPPCAKTERTARAAETVRRFRATSTTDRSVR